MIDMYKEFKAEDILLEVSNLSVDFPVSKGLAFWKKDYVSAVRNVSLKIPKGECVAIVGESGCGKTTLANTMIGLIKPTGGDVLFNNRDIYTVSNSEYRDIRTHMQLIFQDPYSSMNHRFTVRDIIAEPYRIRKTIDESEIDRHVEMLLDMVGLSPRDMDRHIYNFSGGQRQRIAIARAIALNPEFLICDEPVSALDVSVHAQILNLLIELQKKLNLTYLFISHNLAVVRNISSYVAVMYLGEIVEYGKVDDIFNNPIHPYTKALLSSVKDDEPIILEGDIPSPINPPSGCRFNTRCGNSRRIISRSSENSFVDLITGEYTFDELACEIEGTETLLPTGSFITSEIATAISKTSLNELVVRNIKCFTEHPELQEIEEGQFAACNLLHPNSIL